MLEKIQNAFKHLPDNENIYLIEKLSGDSGFFICNNHILYMVKNFENNFSKTIATEFVKLYTNIDILSVENDNQFDSGKYNILEFTDDNDINNQMTFINLCIAHTQYLQCKDFLNFFYSLIDIFQLPKEQEFKNLLGYYGELAVIEYCHSNLNKDLSVFWHKDDLNSKYDFCLNRDVNIEVKTTLNTSEGVTIKHKQLFNEDNNFLVVVVLEKNVNGISFNELVQKLLTNKKCCKNYNFTLNIEKIRKFISPTKAKEEKFKVKEILVYDTKNINPILGIQENIYDISYKMDLPKSVLTIRDIEKEI